MGQPPALRGRKRFRVFPLVPWDRATRGTLCGGPPSGDDPRRTDALALLPQGTVTFSIFEWRTEEVQRPESSRCLRVCKDAGPLPTGLLIDVKRPDKKIVAVLDAWVLLVEIHR